MALLTGTGLRIIRYCFMADFHFSKWRPSAILDFQKLEILTARTLLRAEVRHHAKFREDRSNRSGDMADFQSFNTAAAAILDFGNFKFLMAVTLKRVELRLRAKFCRNRSNRGEIWRFFDFSRWRRSAVLDFQKLEEISTSGPVRRPNMRHRAKFREDRSKRSGDIADFQDGGRPLIPGSSGGLQSRCLRLPVKTISTDFSLLNTAIADMPRLNLVSALTIGLDRPELSNLSNKPKIVS